MANVRNNAAKNAVAAAKQAAKTPVEKQAETTPVVDDAQRFKGKLCKVIGGKKLTGETLKVFAVTKGNAYRKPLALCEGTDKLTAEDMPVFMKPEYLEIVGDMTAADIKRLDERQTAQSEETLYVAGTATRDTDKAVELKVPGWFKRVYFTKSAGDKAGMISNTGFTDTEGMDIFEVAAWKVRKEVGMDSYTVLKAKQTAFAAIVEAKPAK